MAETNKDYILQVRNLKKYFPIEKTLFGKPITYLKALTLKEVRQLELLVKVAVGKQH